jgi:hypothetical protein
MCLQVSTCDHPFLAHFSGMFSLTVPWRQGVCALDTWCLGPAPSTQRPGWQRDPTLGRRGAGCPGQAQQTSGRQAAEEGISPITRHSHVLGPM